MFLLCGWSRLKIGERTVVFGLVHDHSDSTYDRIKFNWKRKNLPQAIGQEEKIL